MNPNEFVLAVRKLRARRHPAADATLARLGHLIKAFVADPANRRVPWPTAGMGGNTRLLLNDPGDDFQIVLVTWPSGSRSTIHAHGGTLGAVAALAGTTAETRYRVVDDDGSSVRLQAMGLTRLAGKAVSLLAPEEGQEIHEMVHAAGAPAATVHVYLTPLQHVDVFEPLPDGRHRRGSRPLALDMVHGADAWTRAIAQAGDGTGRTCLHTGRSCGDSPAGRCPFIFTPATAGLSAALLRPPPACCGRC